MEMKCNCKRKNVERKRAFGDGGTAIVNECSLAALDDVFYAKISSLETRLVDWIKAALIKR